MKATKLMLLLLALASCRSTKTMHQSESTKLLDYSSAQVQSFSWLGELRNDSLEIRETITEYDSAGAVKKTTQREITKLSTLALEQANMNELQAQEEQCQSETRNTKHETKKKTQIFTWCIVGIGAIITLFILSRFDGFKKISGAIARLWIKNGF